MAANEKMYPEMSEAVRQRVQESAVMETLVENKLVLSYFEDNPGQAHPGKDGQRATLCDILKYAEDHPKHEDSNGPQLQILRDYFTVSDADGNKVIDYDRAAQYVIHDYQRSSDIDQRWDANIMITAPSPAEGEEPRLYVAFGGTQAGEGVDNSELMYMESTPQQRAAREYFDSLVQQEYNQELFKNSYVDVGGHSKGGNKATYITLTSQYAEYIDSCTALDAPGYSPEAIEHFKTYSDFDERRSKITLVAGEYDYVHPLGINNSIVPEGNWYYVKTDLEKACKGKDGKERMGGPHYQHYLFQQDADGRFTSTLQKNSQPSEMVLKEMEFMEEFMKLSPEQRKEAAYPLMMLLWGERSPDGAHLDLGMLQLLLAAFDNPIQALSFLSAALLVVYPELETVATILTVFTATSMLNPALLALGAGAFIKLLPTMTALAILLFGAWAVSKVYGQYMKNQAESQQEMLEQMSIREADEHPEFYIDPATLTAGSTANTNGRIGAEIYSMQTELQRMSASFTFRPVDMMSTGSDTFDPAEIDRLQSLKDMISAKEAEIRNLQDDFRACISHLEQIKTTLNGVLAYMGNTGNHFTVLEKELANAVRDLDVSAALKK